jgi:hypothetical protein
MRPVSATPSERLSNAIISKSNTYRLDAVCMVKCCAILFNYIDRNLGNSPGSAPVLLRTRHRIFGSLRVCT